MKPQKYEVWENCCVLYLSTVKGGQYYNLDVFSFGNTAEHTRHLSSHKPDPDSLNRGC